MLNLLGFNITQKIKGGGLAGEREGQRKKERKEGGRKSERERVVDSNSSNWFEMFLKICWHCCF